MSLEKRRRRSGLERGLGVIFVWPSWHVRSGPALGRQSYQVGLSPHKYSGALCGGTSVALCPLLSSFSSVSWGKRVEFEELSDYRWRWSVGGTDIAWNGESGVASIEPGISISCTDGDGDQLVVLLRLARSERPLLLVLCCCISRFYSVTVWRASAFFCYVLTIVPFPWWDWSLVWQDLRHSTEHRCVCGSGGDECEGGDPMLYPMALTGGRRPEVGGSLAVAGKRAWGTLMAFFLRTLSGEGAIGEGKLKIGHENGSDAGRGLLRQSMLHLREL
ncbi:hypothetical protein DFP72DRAFT_838509 [Ephemerocybe angulata]|uniref:Uncharacterized protein n=1 Tax=Ephemerocybe angulata TaxID=980116 RepID=A0A8H6MGM1_9AGAR|nr:hypothetical protein DFP72DRAFT_838509 [Tulosesus angulatus]